MKSIKPGLDLFTCCVLLSLLLFMDTTLVERDPGTVGIFRSLLTMFSLVLLTHVVGVRAYAFEKVSFFVVHFSLFEGDNKGLCYNIIKCVLVASVVVVVA